MGCNTNKVDTETVLVAADDYLILHESIVKDIDVFRMAFSKKRQNILKDGIDLAYINDGINRIEKVNSLFDATYFSLVHSFLRDFGVHEDDFNQFIEYNPENDEFIGLKLNEVSVKKVSEKSLNFNESDFYFNSEDKLDLENLLVTFRDSAITVLLHHPLRDFEYSRPKNLEHFRKFKHAFNFNEISEPFFYELYFDEKDILKDDEYHQSCNILEQLKVFNSRKNFYESFICLNKLILSLRKIQLRTFDYLAEKLRGGWGFTKAYPMLRQRYNSSKNLLELRFVNREIEYKELRYSYDPELPKNEWKTIINEEYNNSIVFDSVFTSPTVIYFDVKYTSGDDSIWIEMIDTIGPIRKIYSQFQ